MDTRLTNRLLLLITVLLAANLVMKGDWLQSASATNTELTHDVIRARLIELVAADGKVVAQLHTADDGAANLRLRDGSGEVRVKLGATANGSGLILMNRDTEPAVSLAAADETGTLTMTKPGAPALVLRP